MRNIRQAIEGEQDELRRAARYLKQRNDIAVKIVEVALVAHGASRHPLVDALLDIRNALRAI